ncbi:MAG: FkbM family methyltransferase [Ruminococcus flavefaciens]|nr:FkbM family methyltransferase [Ruminococcus flavefaciens]
MDYRKQLEEAIEYAVESGSFSKLNLAEQADVVCAYGTGRFFQEAFEQWDFLNRMHVSMVCDSDEKKWGKQFIGLPCISPKELFAMNLEKRVLVITFIGNPAEINKELKKNNVFYVSANDCIFEMICNMERSKTWFQKNNILEVFDWLEDEESRRVYVNVLCNRIAPHLSQYDYDELYSQGEYFDTDAFKLDKMESYVDCGAYNGDTIERMLAICGGAEHIYAFEMDKGNFAALQSNIEILKSKYRLSEGVIDAYNAGVWDSNEKLPYGKETCGSSESFCLFKEEIIDYAQLVKLDDLLKGKRVSLIKMDIEGAEYKALQGARDTIVSNEPKLTICLYHRLYDFWEIPTYIKTLVPQYKLQVRHHQNGTMGGTVIYAVK